jgi:dTDP-4-dehydrorhamnose 3,5-epimerase
MVVDINFITNDLAGTVRGFHFQHSPFKEAKILTVLTGSIFDVLWPVEMNHNEYAESVSFELDAHHGEALYIPPGFAHGYQTRQNQTNLLYLHNEAYDPLRYARFNPLDPDLGVAWPLPISEISDADRDAPSRDVLFNRFKD